MICKECGFEADGLVFCPICGSKLVEGGQPKGAAAPFTGIDGVMSSSASPASSTVPTFTPPADGKSVGAASSGGVPVFTPPADGKSVGAASSGGVPVFTPPADGKSVGAASSGGVPVFTPPGGGIGHVECCHDHKSKRAVAYCERCGHPMCEDCVTALGVESGEYAGKPLCASCTRELVAENVQMLKDHYSFIKKCYISMAIGAVIGLVIMSQISPLLAAIFSASNPKNASTIVVVLNILGACAGLGFRLFFKDVGKIFGGVHKDASAQAESLTESIVILLLTFLLAVAGGLVFAPIRAIQTIIRYVRYQRQTADFIEQDTAALEAIDQYMSFTAAMEQYPGSDLSELTRAGGVLENNPYVQTFLEYGEQAVESRVREQAEMIAANGEIVRRFNEEEIAPNGEIIRNAA